MEFEIEWIESDNYKLLKDELQQAYDNNRFIGVIGGSGWGKSLLFEIFKKEKPNVFVEEIESTMDTDIFFKELVKKFRRQDYSTNKLFHTIRDASNVVKKLTTNSMFIFDEAGNFKPSMLKHIRDFRKHTKENSSLVISGPFEPFYVTLEALAEKNKYGTKEFMTRVNKWVFLEEPSIEEMISVFKINGFEDKLITELVVGCDNFRDVENKITNYWIENGINPKLRQNAI